MPTPTTRCHPQRERRTRTATLAPVRILTYLLATFAGVFLSSCQTIERAIGPVEGPSSYGILSPDGRAAREIADLWWVMLAISGVVYVFVLALLLVALFRRRQNVEDRQAPPPRSAQNFVIVSGVIIPVVILVGLFGFTLSTMDSLGSGDPAFRIDVIGKQWWWEVRYPEFEFETANEIRIPVGVPVEIYLTSADVVHSFWVPELSGKVDLIPGVTTTIELVADREGIFYGQCAEYCGVQHAKMAFYVVAMDSEDFEEWVELQQLPAPDPDNPITLQGLQIFLGSACVYCHRIEGTNATSDFGPDLTHLMSRLTLGAGAIPNTRGHLAGWIIDSQSIKPGNKMPPMYLDPESLQALLAYLETLR